MYAYRYPGTALQAELERLKPAEIVHPAEENRLFETLIGIRAVVNEHEDWVFAADSAEYTLRDHFGVQSLDGFGLKGRHAATGAAGGALHYLVNTLRRDVARRARGRRRRAGPRRGHGNHPLRRRGR